MAGSGDVRQVEGLRLEGGIFEFGDVVGDAGLRAGRGDYHVARGFNGFGFAVGHMQRLVLALHGDPLGGAGPVRLIPDVGGLAPGVNPEIDLRLRYAGNVNAVCACGEKPSKDVGGLGKETESSGGQRQIRGGDCDRAKAQGLVGGIVVQTVLLGRQLRVAEADAQEVLRQGLTLFHQDGPVVFQRERGVLGQGQHRGPGLVLAVIQVDPGLGLLPDGAGLAGIVGVVDDAVGADGLQAFRVGIQVIVGIRLVVAADLKVPFADHDPCGAAREGVVLDGLQTLGQDHGEGAGVLEGAPVDGLQGRGQDHGLQIRAVGAEEVGQLRISIPHDQGFQLGTAVQQMPVVFDAGRQADGLQAALHKRVVGQLRDLAKIHPLQLFAAHKEIGLIGIACVGVAAGRRKGPDGLQIRKGNVLQILAAEESGPAYRLYGGQTQLPDAAGDKASAVHGFQLGHIHHPQLSVAKEG